MKKLLAGIPKLKCVPRLHIFSFILFALAYVATATADENAMTKYRNYTPQQVKEMPEKMRSEKLPMTYIFATQKGLAVDSELLFGMQLSKLMYSGVHDYKSAVMAFQKDIGGAPSGVLTVWQIHQLEYRSNLQKLGKVFFPTEFFSFKQDGYAYIKGTVTILDDKVAWPVNRQKITCWKAENSCEVSQVMLLLPNQNDWSSQYHVMVDDTEYYNITRWTDDTIDAEYPRKPDACRTVSLSLNFKTKEFYFITKNAGGKCDILGTPLEKLSKPRIAQIVDGEKIIDEEFGRIAKAAYEVLASDFRKRMDKFITQSNKK